MFFKRTASLLLLSLTPLLASAWTINQRLSSTIRRTHSNRSSLMVTTNNNQDNGAPNDNQVVNEGSQTLEELTDAFLEEGLDVDEFLAAIENQVEKVESQQSSRKATLNGVDQVAWIAREGAAAFLKTFNAMAMETEHLAETLPQARVGNKPDSVTYGEAFQKVGKGAQGLLALATALGGLVKETENQETKSTANKAEEPVQLLLPDIPNQSLTEEEMKYSDDSIDEPKGSPPSVLSTFLKSRNQGINTMIDIEEEEIEPDTFIITAINEEDNDDQYSIPEEGQDPNFLAFFLDVGSKKQ